MKPKLLLKSTLVTLLLISSFTSVAQEWVDLMLETNSNYYGIKDAFHDEWKGKDYERGKGWKQFHRWENF